MSRREIRLVVSDVDGTLVRMDKTLADANVAAVARLRKAGIGFTIISARPPSGMLWIAERLGLDGPLGAFNGGTIVLPDGMVQAVARVPRAVAERVLAAIARADVMAWVFADGIWHTQRTDDVHTPREVKSAGQQPTIVADFAGLLDTVDKIVAVSDDAPLLDRLQREIAAAAGDNATVARSQTYYLDITARTANKGEGIAALADAFGVPLGETAAFGDQHNDLPMFARAALSVAMAQGPADVRAKADEVSTSNDDDGVAHAIDRFILADRT